MSGRFLPMSVSMTRLVGLTRKETLQVLRDPSTIMIAVILPLLLLFLFGYGVTFDPRSFNVGLVIERPTAETGSFKASLENSRFFEVKSSHDRRFFEQGLVAGRLNGIIILKEDFAGSLYRADIAPIQVIVDGSDPNTAYLVGNYVQLLWANWLTQVAVSTGQPRGPPVANIEPQIWYNPEVSSKNYLVPGSIAITLTMIGALLTALVVAREWERGTMEALLATPIRITELIIGKIIPYFLLGIGSMILSVVTAILVFDVPFRGSFFLLLLTSSVFMLCALGQGLLISTITRNQLVAAQISILSAFLPAFYFSNFVFEIDSMPWALRMISYVVPARYFVSSLQTLFLSGDVWAVIAPDLIGLAIFAIIIFAVTARVTRTRLD